MESMHTEFSISDVQRALAESGLDGWLCYDFRGSDPIARKVLGLATERPGTRRWYYWIPRSGEPVRIVHAIESGVLDGLPGRQVKYLSWQSLREALSSLFESGQRVAMQYSPENAVPYVSRVDAGTVEQVRSFGVEVVSSADLVQRFDAVLSEAQIESHRRAATFLRLLVGEIFDWVGTTIGSGGTLSERDILNRIEAALTAAHMIYDHPAIVGVNKHAADPHFEVPETGSASVKEGDLLLVDVWCKESIPGAIYADITWTAFVGREVPDEVERVFEVVLNARDAVIARADEAFGTGTPLAGYELDRVARGVITDAGYGKYYIHRTGHSIHDETHGNGANLDDLETHDTRVLLPRTLFSVEPGIYLPGRFGIRSEVDVFHTGEGAEVTGQPVQTALRALLS